MQVATAVVAVMARPEYADDVSIQVRYSWARV
jgi:hypothetical protein